MGKISYLFGAGASAGKSALPIVNGMPAAFLNAKQLLKDFKTESQYEDLKNEIANGLEWLAHKSEEFASVDTFAKRSYLISSDDFIKVKFLLGAYFMIDQVHYKKFDNRYLVFITTLLRSGNTFPNNLKIISWNYDFQFETACNFFSRIPTKPVENGLKADPIIEYYPNPDSITHEPIFSGKNINIVHLNGIAGFYLDEKHIISNEFLLRQKTLGEMFPLFQKLKDSGENQLLSFAFEEELDLKPRPLIRALPIAKEMIADTTILVIIGYSFPFFNREVDSALFKVLVDNKTLKKIYYQDPNPERDGNFLYSQFDIPETIVIKHIKEVDQLYLPYEL
jgi:hypothetical protein